MKNFQAKKRVGSLSEWADFTSVAKRGTPGGEPVLSFDIKSIGSHSEIDMLKVSDVAQLLRISVTSVRRLQQGLHIPFHKVGGCIRFARNDIMAYLAQQRVESIE